jgi:hypothetical protein
MCVPPIGVPTTPETESKESEGGPERLPLFPDSRG